MDWSRVRQRVQPQTLVGLRALLTEATHY